MLLESSGGLEVGEKLELEFALPENQKTLMGCAKVVRKEAPDRIAVQFMELDSEAREILQAYVAGRVKD